MDSSRISRRQFLKGALALGGAAAAGSLLGACAAPSTGNGGGPIKLGLLLSTSGPFGSVGTNTIDGMKLYFERIGNQAGGRPIELIVEDDSGKADVAQQKARKLVEQDEVAMVAGIVTGPVLLGVRDYFHDNQKPLVVAIAGNNGLARGLKSPYIFRTSGSTWQQNWPMGEWAYRNVGRRAFISVPDFVVGNEVASAFTHAFREAGGEIVGVQKTTYPVLGDPAPFLGEIRAARPDFVYAFYTDANAVSFVKGYSDFGLSGEIPLLGTGYMVEQNVLAAVGAAGLGVRNILHWANSLDLPENKTMLEAYQQAHGKPADVYVVQGYVAARVIADAIDAVQGDLSKTEQLLGALGSAEFASPAGAFKMDPNTNNPIRSFYAREVQQTGGGLTNVILEELGQFGDPGDDSKDVVG